MTAGWSAGDAECMKAALEQARAAGESGEIPVGAVVTMGGRVVGHGHNRTIVDRDPSAHAEIVALRAAAVVCGNHRLTDATLYVTLEPCVMCVGALVEARVRRLVFGAYDSKAGAAGSVVDLTAARYLNHRLEVNGGLLAEECGAMLQDFFAARR